MMRYVWHYIREKYYATALFHLSTFRPFDDDLLRIIIETHRSRAVLKGWTRS